MAQTFGAVESDFGTFPDGEIGREEAHCSSGCAYIDLTGSPAYGFGDEAGIVAFGKRGYRRRAGSKSIYDDSTIAHAFRQRKRKPRLQKTVGRDNSVVHSAKVRKISKISIKFLQVAFYL